jgi:hypothetical protein
MQKKIIAVIFALFAGTITIYLAELISHQIYPPPEGLDLTKPEVFSQYIETIDPSVLLMVLMCYASGAFVAGATANRIMLGKGINQALLVAAILTIFSLMNLLKFPAHPIWFWVIGLTLYIPFTILGAKYMVTVMERMKPKED